MAVDSRVTSADFIANKGYSAKHFFNHATYMLANKPNSLDIDIWRYKVVLTNTKSNKKLILKCHYKGRTNRHVTALEYETRKELLTMTNNISPDVFMKVLLQLLL